MRPDLPAELEAADWLTDEWGRAQLFTREDMVVAYLAGKASGLGQAKELFDVGLAELRGEASDAR